jgi:tetratricopeptide (TPR) repeat protein
MRAHLYRLIEEAPVVVGLGAARREVSPADVRKLEALGYVGSGADAGMVAGMSLKELLEASGADPKDHIDDIHGTMGAIALHHAGDLEAAEKVYRDILARSPQRGERCWLVQSNLGMVLLGQGKNEEAIEYFRAALRIRPEDGKTLTLLGEALAALGRTDEALLEFGKACAIEPVMPRTHWSYAKALRDAGEVKESMRHYRLAIEGDPSFRAAAQADQQAVAKLHASAIGLLRQGKYAEAAETLRAAHTLDPWDLALANDLAWILATCADDAVRDGTEAIRLSEMVQASADEENPAWLDTLAAAYAAYGRFDDAVATVNRAIELARQSGADDLAAKAQARRELYAARRPYRDQ